MTGGLKNLSYEERLTELGLFSLKKQQQREDLTNICMYLKRGAKRMKPGSTQWCRDNRRHRKLHLHKSFLTVCVTVQWNR